MLTRNTLRLFFSLVFCFAYNFISAQKLTVVDTTKSLVVKDTLTKDSTTLKKDSINKKNKFNPQYILIGAEVLKPISVIWDNTKIATEFFAEVPYKNSGLVFESGFVNAKFSSKFLNYTSNSTFIKLGINKFLFDKMYNEDKDEIFSGVRYGLSYIKRGEATYTITDIWGTSTGSVAAKSHFAHWGEIILGLRMQVFKNVFAGWMVRGKFLINGKSFVELPPSYISGYGIGSRPTVMDFGCNVSYMFHK